MKKVYSFCLTIVSVLSVNEASAILNYGLTVTTGVGFTPLGGTAITNLTNGCQDGMVSSTLPIGFTFVYDSQNFTQFKITENGRLFLGAGVVTCSDNCGTPCDAFGPNYQVQLSSGAGNGLSGSVIRSTICPLWDDLGFNVAGSRATYSTTGAAGSRILTVEWILVDWKYNNVNMANTSTISFQVKLYESPAGQIDFIYRREPEAVTAAALNGRIGLIGASAGDYYSTSSAGAAPSKVAETNVNAKPLDGVRFRWSVGVPTPVEMVSFSGKSEGDKNIISWETISETNNKFFTLYRSNDAISFEPVFYIDGAGNSSHLLSYKYIDNSLPNKSTDLYYRLKQTDFDGNFSNSGIISVACLKENNKPPDIYYDINSGIINVSGYFKGKGFAILEIIDPLGKSIYKENLFVTSEGRNTFPVLLPGLSAGIYNARITSADEIMQSKFINY